ncbi:MAG: hypothetical protein IPP14_10940 [Planctomycetes bacterium]|nr:hypothetical protein [Planctomycetota bacterium]
MPATPAASAGSAFVYTIGCQMNDLDSELSLATLADDGFSISHDPAQADVVFVNTCSVREKAEDKAYSFLGRMNMLKRKNPNLVIGVLGCMAQKQGELIFRRAPWPLGAKMKCAPKSASRPATRASVRLSA